MSHKKIQQHHNIRVILAENVIENIFLKASWKGILKSSILNYSLSICAVPCITATSWASWTKAQNGQNSQQTKSPRKPPSICLWFLIFPLTKAPRQGVAIPRRKAAPHRKQLSPTASAFFPKV